MSLRRFVHRGLWIVPTAVALIGVIIGIAAWRCRSETRVVGIRLFSVDCYGSASPRCTLAVISRHTAADSVGDDRPLATVGPVTLYTSDDLQPTSESDNQMAFVFRLATRSLHAGRYGYGYFRAAPAMKRHSMPTTHFVQLPTSLMVAVAIGPLIVLLYRRHRRQRRIAANQCAACGYDLRATPGRCPECGAVG